MTKTLSCILTLVTLFLTTSAQDVKSDPAEDVVRISTNLIQLDVSVVDRHGKTVADLAHDEIELFENGTRQDIRNFAFVSRARTERKDKQPDSADLPPVVSDVLATGPRNRVFALVVDDISLSFESTHHVRQALTEFVDRQMVDGDLVAILKTGGSTGVLQQFTSNKDLLRAAIDSVRWNPSSNGGLSPLGQNSESGVESDADRERGEILSNASLSALNQMVKGMSVLPGRKSVIFMSEGFSLITRNSGGFVDTSRVLASIRRITDTAHRSGVAVYTIDARGLQTAALTVADNVKSAAAAAGLAAARRRMVADTQDGLKVLAEQAGGFSIFNTNGISKGIERILEAQGYYLLAYEPDEKTFNSKKSRFNNIEVRVKRRGLIAYYRSGFFNQPGSIDTSQPSDKGGLVSVLSSPISNGEISLRLQSIYLKDAASNPLVWSALYIPGTDLTFTAQAEGKFAVDFEILALSLGVNGSVADRITRSYSLEVTELDRDKLVREGIVYFFQFPIARPGAYQYRVAVRDRRSGRIGTAGQFITIPDERRNPVTLSGIALENITKSEWLGLGNAGSTTFTSTLRDTSLRRFKQGTVVAYGVEAYLRDAAPSGAVSSHRLFKNGQLVLNTAASKVSVSGHHRVAISGAIELTPDLDPGEYLLQVIVDAEAGKASYSASQSVSFQIVH